MCGKRYISVVTAVKNRDNTAKVNNSSEKSWSLQNKYGSDKQQDYRKYCKLYEDGGHDNERKRTRQDFLFKQTGSWIYKMIIREMVSKVKKQCLKSWDNGLEKGITCDLYMQLQCRSKHWVANIM